jgi:hypothetical protein
MPPNKKLPSLPSQMTDRQLLEAIWQRLERAHVPLDVAMWDTADIAAYMKLSYTTVRDKVLTKPGFPQAHRPGTGRAKAIYLAREVIAWAEGT